jgi:hypothetical protein
MFCKARFGTRYLGRGMGLGNRLFAWARCRVFAKRHGIPVIAPVWFRPGFGTLIRGGVELNELAQIFYSGMFKAHPDEISTVRGAALTWTWKEVHDQTLDESFLEQPGQAFLDQPRVVLVFHGYRGFFRPLAGFSDYIHSELRLITQPKYLERVDALGDLPIVINIRHGNDFPDPVIINGKLQAGTKTPIDWFRRALEVLRDAVDYNVPAMIVSDARKDVLRPLLDLPEVRLLRPTSPISDLLTLAKARVLLASGSSSFSAWGAWLGQMPAISHPGQPLMETWRYQAEKGQVSVEFDPAHPHQAFLEQARAILRNAL